MLTAVKNEKKFLLYLFGLYTLSQGIILFVSGLWFDDWTIINISQEGLKQWAIEMGKPEFYPIVSIIIYLPDFAYKLFIFGAYYVVTIIFYLIIKEIFKLESRDAFQIAVIYLSIPVNDIRIERLGIPYALGMMLFFLGFFTLVYRYDTLSIAIRGFVLIIFFFSYILNSLLVFMALVWMYILYKEKNIKKCVQKIDFFAVPFIFYLIKNKVYPAQGIYGMYGYNSVGILAMISAVRRTIIDVGSIVGQIIDEYSNVLEKNIWILLVIFVVAYILCVLDSRVHEGGKGPDSINFSKTLALFVIGLMVIFAGLYPYVVVGNTLTISGFDSRNVMLLPFGLALVSYSFFKMGLKRRYMDVILIVFYVVSILMFNRNYIGYQQSYYRNKGLQICLAKYDEIKGLRNVAMCDLDGKDSIGWYMYNGMFEEVYGDESRLVQNWNSFVSFDPSFFVPFRDREWYNMTAYDLDYTQVDCLILYSNNMTIEETVTTRMLEILGHNIDDRLVNKSQFQIIYPDDELFYEYF